MILLSVILAFFTVGHEIIALLIFGGAFLVLAFTLLNYGVSKGNKALVVIRRVCITLILLGFAVYGVLEYNVVRGSEVSEDVQAPFLIVLGAKVNGENPSLILSERLEAAKEYMDEYPESIAVLSGGRGNGENISEAQAMENWLIGHGIDKSRLIKEESSTNTWENIEYSMDILEGLQSEGKIKVTVVTSDFHLYRGKYIARQYGFDASGYPAETHRADLRINYFIREGFAVVKMYLKQLAI